VLGGAGLWWFLRDDAPAPADLESAVAAVDTDSGTFDYENATGTFAGFRIQENLASIGSTTAVGSLDVMFSDFDVAVPASRLFCPSTIVASSSSRSC
jgi:hypothetical protein